MRDHTYDRVQYRPPQLEHRYGPNVHVLADPLALTQLARLCATATPTRMIDSTPQAVFHGETIDPEVRAVTVNIARAGTLPSQITYDFLNTILDPRVVRQ